MRVLSLIKIFMLALLLAATASSAQSSGQTETVGSEEAGSQTEQLDELIQTLESEAGRAELVAELKALAAARAEDSADPEPKPEAELADALKIDEQAEQWKQRYSRFLEKHVLNASLVGYLTVTAILLLVALLALFAYSRFTGLLYHKLQPLISRYYLSGRRMALYEWVMRLCGYVIILLITLWALLALWQVDVDPWIPRNIQLIILQTIFSVVTVFAVGAFIIELSNGAVEYLFRRKLSHQAARMNTLLPIVRNLLLAILLTLFGLTLLSQLGLDVVPLLAGAGVVGFAVGFAAQTLIKDMLVGFIVILEDLIQVGDVATLGGKSGLVEKITVRKVQLRDLDGTVFTVPFSEVTIVANLTKNFSYYLLDLGVAYRENTDEVIAILKELDSGMRADDAYKDVIMEPMEVLGVDRFAASAVMIKARIKTLPLKQWMVGREFNRRMKLAFDEKGIEMPFPHQTVYFGQNKDGKAPPVRVEMPATSSANDAAASAE